MRVRPMALFLTLAAGLLVLAGACKGGPGEKAVDDTAREISDEELAQMVLALGEFGQEFAGFQLDQDSGFKTVEQAAEEDFDPEGEAQDLEQFGWATGYEQNFWDEGADAETYDLFVASSDVSLFETAEGAAGYFADTLSEMREMEGETSYGFTVEEVETFGAEVADESAGSRISGNGEDEGGPSYAVSATGVAFRHGRIIGTVWVAAYGKVRADEKLRELAGKLDERIASVLAGRAVFQPEAPTPEPLVSNAIEVLGASVERFQQEVSALRGEAEFNMAFSGVSIEGTATFVFQAPDQMYLTMDFTGGSSSGDSGLTLDLSGLGTVEMLMQGTEFYLKYPFLGDQWLVMSLTDFGVDAEQFRELSSNHSLVDYQALVESLGATVEELGEETVDGGTYTHYRATLDLADALAAAEAVLGSGEDLSIPSGFGGPMVIDFWLEPDSLLPYKFVMTGEFGMQGQAMGFDMTLWFFDYNQPVEIPEAPADAVPFDELDLPEVPAGP